MTRRRFLAASAAAGAGALVMPWRASAAVPNQPLLEKIDLFDGGRDGYAIYRIPGLVVTAAGSLLAYCGGRRTGKSDWDDVDIFLRRSTDGGRTWSPQRLLADATDPSLQNPVSVRKGIANAEGDLTADNPVAIADRRTGAVHFLYCVEYGHCFYMRSDDDGQTFSEAVNITSAFEEFRPRYDWKVIATGPGHGIQLENGRLIVPIWMSTGEGGHAHRPSAVSVIYSDDSGASWHAGEIVASHGVTYTYPDRPDVQAFVNPSETIVVQLADGRVMLNIRTESPEMRRAVAYSADGATGWTVPVFDEQLYEPICMASIARVTAQPEHDRNRIIFANPDSRHKPRKSTSWSGSRENLSVKLSYDEGESWAVDKVLDPGFSGYSDLAVGPDKTMYCFYERGGIGDSAFQPRHLTLARFNLAWLTDGRDTLDRS